MTAYRELTFRSQDGLDLYCRDYGDPLSPRTPVLCLSGLVRNSADFDPLATRLMGERRVLCPDYRGRGRSARDPDWSHYEPRTYINDILHLLTLAGIGRAVIVGTSLGGLLATAIAVLRPTAVAGVVLNDIGPDVATDGLARITAYVGTDHPQPDWQTAVRYLRHLLPRLAPKADDAWWRQLAEGTYRQGADGLLHFDWDVAIAKPFLHQQQKLMPDLWALYRGLRRLPALALRGEISDILSEEAFRRMALEKPDLVCVTVPDVGHTPSLGEPTSIAALDAFLSKL
ncbi:MAG TPA: alpha/beta hydrolase [Stellaceae bacterium]|nr:alpha/beta hydrolase [Stellaceae bacterium]